jgi:hypothetical protein
VNDVDQIGREPGAHGVERHWRVARDPTADRVRVVSRVRQVAGECLVQDDPERIDVGARVDRRVPGGLLGDM